MYNEVFIILLLLVLIIENGVLVFIKSRKRKIDLIVFFKVLVWNSKDSNDEP